MLDVKKYAAIDIGSNAVRLLINTVTTTADQPPYFQKTSLVRVPIRLGSDVFVDGSISPNNEKRLKDTLEAFALLLKSHHVEIYKACATSAMRDADNGDRVADDIKAQTGITVEIIDGDHEAAYIATSDLRNIIQNDQTYLYVDVGGGSTEFTIYANGEAQASKSLKLGTVRLLNNMVDDHLWEEAKQWIRQQVKRYNTVEMIGTGGNINHLFKRSGQKQGTPLEYFYLKEVYQELADMSYDERVAYLHMKLDRADVILPATQIYLFAMKWGGARWVHVPKIGLADGIIKTLYYNNQNSVPVDR